VSLHSHSECSRETLAFIPHLAKQIPVVAGYFEKSIANYQQRNGRPLNFSEWYWRPPLSPAAVIESERAHLERRLDLPALVSLTDHDTVQGPVALRAGGRLDVPLSFEWSVPYDRCLFHFGVHNIPPKSLDSTLRALQAYTADGPAGSRLRLTDLLDGLSEHPETLVVLNHPFWDLPKVGPLRHEAALLDLMRTQQGRIHALELNGYRAWTENRRVLPLAKSFGLPLVGGGDRHGLVPNTIVNLTRAQDLAEFAHELRVDRVSHCAVFPEYAEPHMARIVQQAAVILGPLPDHHRGYINWQQRVFTTVDGVERSVSTMWEGGPPWMRGVIAIFLAFSSKPFSALYRLSRGDGRAMLEADCRSESPRAWLSDAEPDSAAA
jgi:hypothetical protein